MKGGSGESVESNLIVQRNAFRSSELICNVVKRATFCLWEANPGESESNQSHGHEEEVDIRTAEFLYVRETHENSFYLDLIGSIRSTQTQHPQRGEEEL